MAGPVLEVRDLQTHFFTDRGVVRAVDGVSFSVGEGEVMGLVGESGSGKSVTGFSILDLVDPPGRIVSGSIRFKGRELIGLDAAAMRDLRGSGIAMIFQDPMMTLNPALRIDTQMIEAVLAHRKMSRAEARQHARACLERVGVTAVDERLASYPHQLSGGLRQRVGIATALLNEPELIIADEPTTALDVTIQAQILHEMQKLCAESKTALIWISHDLSVVAGLASRICVMYAGRDVEQGPVTQVLDRPAHPYTRGLLSSVPARTPRGMRLPQLPGTTPSLLTLGGGCAFAPRCPERSEICAHAPERTGDPAGVSVRCHHPIMAATPAPVAAVRAVPDRAGTIGASRPVLEVRNLMRRFESGAGVLRRGLAAVGLGPQPHKLEAVADVSFDIARGEVVGLVGESGCGKSTIGRMIAGILQPSGGEILFDGRPISTLTGRAKSHDDLPIQMIFQDPFSSLNPRMRVRDIIGEPALVNGIITASEFEDYVDHLMERCGLDPSFKLRFPHQFSGGQRQRIGIARALAVRPRLLVCDESVSALDVSIQAQIINLFADLRDEFSLTYLFISHDLSVIEHICDRVLVMYLGRIVEEAPAGPLFRAPLHPYTFALADERPRLDQRAVAYQPIPGEIPSPLAPPPGCHFHPRCPSAGDFCTTNIPVLTERAPSRKVACHYPREPR